jgi:hypothetical protein
MARQRLNRLAPFILLVALVIDWLDLVISLSDTQEAVLDIVSTTIWVAVGTYLAIVKRDRVWAAFAGVMVLLQSATFAFDLTEGDSVVTNVAVFAIIVLFFFLPLPVILFSFTKLQDELQRSLFAGAAATAWAVTMTGALGAWFLATALDMPPVSSGWLLLGGVGTFLVAWFTMRRRVA